MGGAALFFGFVGVVFTLAWSMGIGIEDRRDEKPGDAFTRYAYLKHRTSLWFARVAWGLCAVCTAIYLVSLITN
jgi:hypothetical protein